MSHTKSLVALLCLCIGPALGQGVQPPVIPQNGTNILPLSNTFTGACNLFADLGNSGGTDLCGGTQQTTGFALPTSNPLITYNYISLAPLPINGVNSHDLNTNWSLLGYMPGPHSAGINSFGGFFDFMAQGSGAQNPNADIALGINIIKQGYGTAAQSTTGIGEIDSMYVISRGVGPAQGTGNSNSPVGGILVSAAGVQGNGVLEWEGASVEVPTNYNYNTPNYAVDTQIGTISHDGPIQLADGFVATEVAGSGTDAFVAQNTGTAGTWQNALTTVINCGSSGLDALHITISGVIEQSSCLAGVAQPYWIMENVVGNWLVVGGVSAQTMIVATPTGQVMTNTIGLGTAVTPSQFFASNVAPIFASGACVGSMGTLINGSLNTAAFPVSTGSGACTTQFTLTMPQAANGWVCDAVDELAGNSTRIVETSDTVTSVQLTNYNQDTPWAATNFVASHTVKVKCSAY